VASRPGPLQRQVVSGAIGLRGGDRRVEQGLELGIVLAHADGAAEDAASGALDQSSPDRAFLVAEDRHSGFHAPEAEFLVKALGTGIGVQDDLLVAGG